MRTKLRDRKLPDYTRGEEIFNMVSHIAGGALGIAALVLCVVFAAIRHNTYGVVGSSIYGFTLVLLYTMSSLYHGISPKLTAKKVFQVIDHCSIFMLIAGTYTPICFCIIQRLSPALGWTVFGIIWGMAALGIVLNSIDLKQFEKFSMICYLGMGWCIIVSAKNLLTVLGVGGIVFLVAGGVAYTVGAVFFVIGKNKKYAHSVFHLFVVLGSLLHFLCIFFFAI